MTKPYLKPIAHDNPPKKKAFLKCSWTLPRVFSALCPKASPSQLRSHTHPSLQPGDHWWLPQPLSELQHHEVHREHSCSTRQPFQRCSEMASETPARCKAWSRRDKTRDSFRGPPESGAHSPSDKQGTKCFFLSILAFIPKITYINPGEEHEFFLAQSENSPWDFLVKSPKAHTSLPTSCSLQSLGATCSVTETLHKLT